MSQRDRIFGIGFQRTGTTSLAHACEILGYKVKHGDYLRFPGALDLDDPVYDEYDMFCDTPFFHLFDKLEHRFPNSKFILTLRSTDDWLNSVRRLYEVNKDWQDWPTIRSHQIVTYGAACFREETFANAFTTHNNRVQKHFANDTGRFLVMDLTTGDGWSELCRFLGCEVPQQPFPYTNQLGAS